MPLGETAPARHHLAGPPPSDPDESTSLEVIVVSMGQYMEHDVFLLALKVTRTKSWQRLQVEIGRARGGLVGYLEAANAIEPPALG